ncbi:MAG: M23 family metallopeptidase [Anaerolineae bacterium]|nr:M23 family metallopeptidase [Anaerolineae bacterium]
MRRLLLAGLLIGCLLWPVHSAIAQSDSPPEGRGAPPVLADPSAARSTPLAYLDYTLSAHVSDVNSWSVYALQPAETVSCLAQRWDVSRTAMAEANRLLNPAAALPGQSLRLPSGDAGKLVVAAHRGDTRLELSVRYGLPLWSVLRNNPLPFYTGDLVVLPARQGESACLPYPLVEFETMPQSIVRGGSAVLVMRTAEPSTCDVTFLGRTEPCYAGDDLHLYALLGLSALLEPGRYDLAVRLQADDLETVVTLPVRVERGNYGYQVINPPAQLSGLLDEDLMTGELEYLEKWRTIRTPARSWTFPLAFPLSRVVTISAGYGDRRSYGGLFDGYHSGIDYRAWTGLPVLAPADGVVLMAEKLEARGNAILVDHGWGLVTGYWHLSRLDVEEGQHVRRGQPLGLVGNTGLSTGSHLHWEVWVNGVSVDGTQWLDTKSLVGTAFVSLGSPAIEEMQAHPRAR